ncbi:STAS domain-containing protein [Allosalinactinospora lopnorensis]|uniref:STAS domain-containing protein n=1 Tax=Allosalinactinospora lopnorensis TaxID=1352348 RepID=UPI0006960DF5|nr:STAS domain-containing protein [Allosalinactinospora lopnorensis]
MEVDPAFDDGTLRISRTVDPPGLRLEGELDATRHSVLTDALSSVTDTNSEVHLDFSQLSFIDLGTLNLLTSWAARSGHEAQLVLDNPSPEVENLIETVSWDRLPGLVQGQKENS